MAAFLLRVEGDPAACAPARDLHRAVLKLRSRPVYSKVNTLLMANTSGNGPTFGSDYAGPGDPDQNLGSAEDATY